MPWKRCDGAASIFELESNPELAYVTQIELRQRSEPRKEIGSALKPYIVLIENILEQGIKEQKFRSDLERQAGAQPDFWRDGRSGDLLADLRPQVFSVRSGG